MRKKILICFVLIPLFFLLYSYIHMIPEKGGGIASSYGFSYPLVIAHRGASYDAPEATKAAYEIALKLKPEYIEIDLQLSKDGIPVCVHDPNLKRVTNVEEVFPDRKDSGPAAFTLEELKKLDAGSWFNKEFPSRARDSYKGLKILSFEEVLELHKNDENNIGIYIETKHPKNSPGIEKKSIELLRKYRLLRPSSFEKNPRLVFQSFNPESILKLRKLAPHIPGTLLFCHHFCPPQEEHFGSNDYEKLLSVAKKSADGIGLVFTSAYPGLINDIHLKGLFVHVYTVDHLFLSMLIIKLGADGIFTNRPAPLLNKLGRLENSDINPIIEKLGY